MMMGLLAASAAFGAVFEYKTTSDWGTGFNGEISVRNDGTTPWIGWSLEFDFNRDLGSIWDARVESRTGTRYVIRPVGWNERIEPGGKVTFGFGGSPGNVSEGPKGFRLVEGSAPPGAKASVSIRETSRSADGFTATLLLTNSGAEDLRSWRLSFRMDAPLGGFWNGEFRREGPLWVVTPSANAAPIGPGGSVLMGFTGTGRLSTDSAGECTFNGEPCGITVTPFAASTFPAGPIAIEGEPATAPITLLRLGRGEYTYRLRAAASGSFRAVSSNPSVATVALNGDSLRITTLSPGRTSIRIDDAVTGATRMIGVRANHTDGTAPGLPPYVAIGSVSDDSPAHLNFWRAIDAGPRNRRMDARYIYLNGGPVSGWDTWSFEPGGRAVQFIRNGQMLGMIPYFVFYNIPDSAEGYDIDLQHAQSLSYMSAYFTNLRMFLEIARRESPDEMVGLILEPDFLGYMAQNAGRPAAEIPAAVRAIYDTGVLAASDPKFPDTVKGLVEAINFAISKHAPNVAFGWQMNLWASPPGGYTTPTPVRGLMHHPDAAAIPAEAAAIAKFYLDAGVTSHGARFFALDKYGLDATGFEPKSAEDPASSTWFWNRDQWRNYLAFTRAASETLGLPAVLWQLPVGRINSTREANPYSASGKFEDLKNAVQSYEDSAAPFFFGDTFTASGPRFEHFAGRPGEGELTWPSHMDDAARSGVIAILFGAGVGASTNSVGDPPSDGYWWITKAQRYFASGPAKVTVDSAPNLR